ncbi:hypothetical protein [Dactylosporangium sp. NPDC005555]|uniref:hypothetical protein n=1 Tax=Dactylosporangium sp. NPDC005555 TaxID=3154889 RepID=UPI0033BF21DB
MNGFALPAYLPEWRGAAAAVAAADMVTLRRSARDPVDLVFAEDTRFLDALAEPLESAIVTPLAGLSQALAHGTNVEIFVASRLVRRSVEDLLAGAPPELRRLVSRLPAATAR